MAEWCQRGCRRESKAVVGQELLDPRAARCDDVN